jgi:hypothetical protein
MDELEEKIKELELEKVTTKTRLEALENWVLKQSDVIESLSKHVSKIDASVLRQNENPENVADEEHDENLEQKKKIECKECGQMFERNCDFERHVEEHMLEKEFQCDICGKDFYLKWRLMKHKEMHTESTKFCHFYNNGKSNHTNL